MADKANFAARYIEAQPIEAARVMEMQAADGVSAFVDRIPDPLSSKALASMLPFHAARCLDGLSDDAGARYLQALSAPVVAAILQNVDPDRRRALQAALSGALAVHVAVLLRYPRHAVGAWMDTAQLTLPEQCTVGDALQRIRNYGSTSRTDIYLVSDTNNVSGVVMLGDLVWSEEQIPVSSLAKPAAFHLAAASTLETAAHNEGWQTADSLPVLDRADRLVGVLRHVDLRTGLASVAEVDGKQDRQEAGENFAIAEFWFVSLAALLNAGLAQGDASSSRSAAD